MNKNAPQQRPRVAASVVNSTSNPIIAGCTRPSRRRFLRDALRIGGSAPLLASPAFGIAAGAGQSEELQAEVCVYGDSGAAVTAAIRAARSGRSVVLASPQRHIGSMHTEGLSHAEIETGWNKGSSAAVGGMAAEFFRRIGDAYGKDGMVWQFEPRVAQDVIDRWLAEHERITVLRGHRLRAGAASVTKRGGEVRTIELTGGRRCAAKVFVDATVEGDLLHAAGVSTVIGREGNARYGETMNGIRPKTTFAQFQRDVDPYREPGEPDSGTIHTVRDEPLGTPGAGDGGISAYCFRMILTRREGNRIPFRKPDGYEPSRYEIYLRYLEAGGRIATPGENLPNGKAEFNAWRACDHNLYGMHDGYPGATPTEREQIFDRLQRFTQGLFYFLANDERVPEPLRQTYSSWGLCADEFEDHAGWPRRLYRRAARRMVSDYVITEHHTDKDKAVEVPDPVAVAYWPPDAHSVRRIDHKQRAYNEGFVIRHRGWRPFGVAYRALVPKPGECTNLISPTCHSSSHIGYGAVRLEWTFMMLGHAAGEAAALAAKNHQRVQDIPYEALRHRLQEAGQVLAVDG